MVGSKVHFQMQIAFPVGTTDLLVELFAPDNDTIVMTLCNPNITFVGSNIQYSNINATPVMEPVINTDYVSHSLISYHYIDLISHSMSMFITRHFLAVCIKCCTSSVCIYVRPSRASDCLETLKP